LVAGAFAATFLVIFFVLVAVFFVKTGFDTVFFTLVFAFFEEAATGRAAFLLLLDEATFFEDALIDFFFFVGI
jgi:hypothetical protein